MSRITAPRAENTTSPRSMPCSWPTARTSVNALLRKLRAHQGQAYENRLYPLDLLLRLLLSN